MHRIAIRVGRLTALIAPVILFLTCSGQAYAEARDPMKSVESVVESTLNGYSLRARTSETSGSELDPAQRVGIDSARFTAGRRIVIVMRAVGATREVKSTQTEPGTRILRTVALPRCGAGTRTALLVSTADRWGPGLTGLSWSERRGVNYHIVSRGGVPWRDLVKVARALPREPARASAKAVRTVAAARPPAPDGFDRKAKAGPALLSGANLNVDGGGTTHDDLGNEASLCAGCAYSSGNYTGFWQYVLWADGNLAWSGVDCVFGAGTASATRNWQRAENLSADGVVGANTRGRADNHLWPSGGNLVNYVGPAHTISFVRLDSSGYYYYDGKRLSYSRAGGTLPGC